MLEDRDYMRQSDEYGRIFRAVPMTYLLIAANLIVFVWTEIAKGYYIEGYAKTFNLFALSNDGLSHGFVWQYLTFQFLHLNRWHFSFNMLGLFFLGRAVEDMIGSKRFLLLYLGSGVVGGIFQTGLGLIFPTIFGIPVAGASAGVFGLLSALATMEPNVDILLFFILPVRIKYVAWSGAIVAIFYILDPKAEPGIAHAAHLGGMLGGFAYIRQFIQHRWHLPQWKLPIPCPAPRELVVKRAGKSTWNSKNIPPAEDLSPDEFLQKEVDPILDKISARGIQSLTPREREILEKARSKMSKR